MHASQIKIILPAATEICISSARQARLWRPQRIPCLPMLADGAEEDDDARPSAESHHDRP